MVKLFNAVRIYYLLLFLKLFCSAFFLTRYVMRTQLLQVNKAQHTQRGLNPNKAKDAKSKYFAILV